MRSVIMGGVGVNGGVTIANTTATTPTGGARCFAGFLTLAETVIDTIAGNVTGLDGVTVPAGIWVEGNFASIQLTSGTVVAYNSAN